MTLNIAPLRFGRLTTDTESMKAVLGTYSAQQFKTAADSFTPEIQNLESQGAHFTMEGVVKNDAKLKGAKDLGFGAQIPWVLVKLVDSNGKLLREDQKFATVVNQITPPQYFWQQVLENATDFLQDQAALTESVEPTPLGLNTKTYFRCLPANPSEKYPGTVSKERRAAQLDKLPPFVEVFRRSASWLVTLPDGKALPPEKALKVNGADYWDVRTIEGLAELSTALREHFKS
jgi:hypothetical protein